MDLNIEQAALLEELKVAQTLDKAFPHGVGLNPEMTVTYDDLMSLKKLKLILFEEKHEHFENKAFESYVVSRGSGFKAYLKDLTQGV
ncbi:hypothetical protein WOSG25_071230 [Weissella oryzae SG25]|uniref:Uncharacterized protein n=2 Tax=Weissella TaxID=46255 RepID=A0A069D1B1_WEIOS|nr:hypothetical protein WOSG25_071230 [Weissella oryzae SG25]